MRYFAGLDVSLNETALCVVDEVGIIIREGKAGLVWLGRPLRAAPYSPPTAAPRTRCAVSALRVTVD